MLETEYRFGEVHDLAAQIESAEDRVHFRNILSTCHGGAGLVAFKAGQTLDRHVAPAEVLVYVVEGEVEFTVADTPHTLSAGQFMLLGRDVPHSVVAVADSKVMLFKLQA